MCYQYDVTIARFICKSIYGPVRGSLWPTYYSVPARHTVYTMTQKALTIAVALSYSSEAVSQFARNFSCTYLQVPSRPVLLILGLPRHLTA